jgi:hypothetical protein
MAEYMDWEPFMIEDDNTYTDVWIQQTKTNGTIT